MALMMMVVIVAAVLWLKVKVKGSMGSGEDTPQQRRVGFC